MRSKIITVSIALALAGALVAPASAAQAASGTVSGTVEYKGKPVAGIPVGWFKPATGSYRVVTTASDGSYSLDLPGAGQEYVLFGNLNMENRKQSRGNKDYVGVFYGDGDTRDYAYQTIDPYTATATADEVDIKLAKPGSISGTDQHLKNQGVYLETMNGHRIDYSGNRYGITYFSNLVPGQYRVVSVPYNDYRFDDVVVTVASGEKTRLVTNAVTGGVVSGVVTGTDGKPAKGVHVRATRATDESSYTGDVTDSKGRYSLTHLHDSSYTLSFSQAGDTSDFATGDRGYLPKSLELTGVTADSKILRDVTLSTGGRLRGYYPNNAGSNSSNTMTLLDSHGDLVLDTFYNVAYVDGDFTLGSLASGRYTAYFQNSNSSTFAKKTFTIKAGATTDLGTIKRDRKTVRLTSTLTGFSTGEDGYAIVSLRKVDGPSYQIGADDSYYTSFSIKTLVPGTYTVTVGAGARENKIYTVTLSADTTRNFAVGAKWGTATATLEVDGLAIPGGRLAIGSDDLYSSHNEIDDGKWSPRGRAGRYEEDLDFDPESVFQAKSPYSLALPEGTLPITLTAGKTNSLGTLAVVVEGGSAQ